MFFHFECIYRQLPHWLVRCTCLPTFASVFRKLPLKYFLYCQGRVTLNKGQCQAIHVFNYFTENGAQENQNASSQSRELSCYYSSQTMIATGADISTNGLSFPRKMSSNFLLSLNLCLVWIVINAAHASSLKNVRHYRSASNKAWESLNSDHGYNFV